MTNRVHDMIVDPHKTARLQDAIRDGGYYGMQTFDQGFCAAVQRGDIDIEEALLHATAPQDLKLLIASDGQPRTSMADVPVSSPGSCSSGVR